MNEIDILREENKRLRKEWEELTKDGYMAVEVSQPNSNPPKYYILPLDRSESDGIVGSQEESK